MEGMDRVTSSQAEWVAQPAGRGSGRVMVCPWKDMDFAVVEERLSWRRSWRRAKQRPPPAESPEKTIWEAETGVWYEPGGGYRRERYAIKTSRRAEGKAC